MRINQKYTQINRKATQSLFEELVNGKTLRPIMSDGEPSDWYYIRVEWVTNARYNEDQTEVLPGYIVRYRYHGSSAIYVEYDKFVWLLEQIFDDIEEFAIVDERK
jgi:hypothetical protein